MPAHRFRCRHQEVIIMNSRPASETRPPLGFRLTPVAARLFTGAIAAAASLSAGYIVFGPFSDMSAIQLAAGPKGDQLGQGHRELLNSRTGRSWAAAEAARQEQATGAAAPTRLARAATSNLRR
jgi:hypothetical protein